MNHTEELDTELQSVADRLRTRVRELEAKLTPIQEQLSRLRIQLDLLDRALGAQAEDPHESVRPPVVEALTKLGVAEKVFEILRDAGRPLHVSEIKTQYEGKGWRIPGQGRESNLLVYIVRDPRFTRVSKGTYALTGEGAPPVIPNKPKTKRRRRKRA